MSCSQCQHMADVSLAATPSQLSQLIRGAQAELRNGVLRALSEPSDHGPRIETLPVEGPWPDILAYALECTACGQVFELSADTYHGGGGWAPRRVTSPQNPPLHADEGRERSWFARAWRSMLPRSRRQP